MEQGHLLLALIAIPLLTALAAGLRARASRRTSSASSPCASALVLFVISLYVFIDYQASDSEQFLFAPALRLARERRHPRRERHHAPPRHRRHRRRDDPAQRRRHLRRHADLLEDRAQEQGLLHPLLPADGRRLRHLHVARPVLLLLLLRARRAADVPAHRRLGLQQRASRPSSAPRNTAP